MLRTITFTVYILSLVLSSASVLFGVTSWIFIKKWRQFRHFVFLSFIIAGTNFLTWIYFWSEMDIIEYLLTTIVILITHIQMTHWQLITTILIYTALVDVFNSANVKCKYLLACLFSWLLPVIEGVIMIVGLDEFLTTWIIVSVIELSILIANIVLYVRVVCSLVRLMMRQKISAKEVCGKVLVSTLACVTAGVPPVVGTIVLMCVADYGPISLLDPELAMVPNLINVFLANVFFLSMKSHRLLWAEYVRRARDSRATQQELEMQLQRNEARVS